MPNPVRGEAELKIGDRTFILAMDMEALIVGESVYGKPMDQLMKDAKAGFVGATRAIFLGALATHHPEVTKEDAIALLQSHGKEIGKALNVAGSLAWPDRSKDPRGTEDGDDSNPPGKSSGRGGARQGSTRKASSGKRLEPTS